MRSRRVRARNKCATFTLARFDAVRAFLRALAAVFGTFVSSVSGGFVAACSLPIGIALGIASFCVVLGLWWFGSSILSVIVPPSLLSFAALLVVGWFVYAF